MIPAFNEEDTIGHVIRAIPRDIAEEVEVLVMNDGSQDRTIEVSKAAGATKVFSQKHNHGLGTNFKMGIDIALEMGADIIVNIDADGQFNPNDIGKIIAPIISGKADMVTCSRFKNPKLVPKMPKVKIFGNKMFARILNIILSKKYHDTQCGFRAYSREAAMHLVLFGKFTYTQEVFIDLVKKGFVIKEVPCKVKGQRGGKSRVVKNVFDYGLKAGLIVLRGARDYEPFKFFGVPGFALFSVGITSSTILFVRWLITGHYDPYLMLVYANIFMVIIGFLLIMLALIADMLDRSRKLQEEILYRMKKEYYDKISE